MSEDAAKTAAGLITLQRLNEVIIKEADSADLRNERKNVCETTNCMLGFCYRALMF